ncbi:MAG: outer membrane lipoprotein-sorting protein [Deltaproteobacteria bacterium]|nr:outer membrane lipoprotein-sorting protein [Deltaproteobacteria bacterium]
MVSYRFKYRWVTLVLCLCATARPAYGDEAAKLVKAAIDYWRDVSSYSVTDMTIHRPKWERTMSLRVWTRGEKESLVRVVSPAKDAGNSTLLADNKMWTFSPKINRIIKIPSSMMYQSWMGSDFSNNDIARADDLVHLYTHRLLGTETREGRKVLIVEATPFDSAPVVWGKEVLAIRDDYVLLEHVFYDQDMVLVKKMGTLEVKQMGGKEIAVLQRMQKMDKPDEWTQIFVKEARFGINIPGNTFTLSNLRNPRR